MLSEVHGLRVAGSRVLTKIFEPKRDGIIGDWEKIRNGELNNLLSSLSQSQSYITTDGQSASLSWNKAPIWGLRPDFCYCQTVAGLFMWGALSLTRGRVCRLQLLLALASAVILGSESRGARDHILLPQIRDFLFVASYDSQGYGGGIRPRLHTGLSSVNIVKMIKSKRMDCIGNAPRMWEKCMQSFDGKKLKERDH
jgi:hypothetical protein